jgi:membrane protein YqaA with SNARE-associated domain
MLLAAFEHLPGISPGLIGETERALADRGLLSLATGAMAGQPYKLYAVHAGVSGVALAPFIAASLAARLARFLLTSAVAWTVGRGLKGRSESFRFRLHAAVWLGFYLGYFAVMRDS